MNVANRFAIFLDEEDDPGDAIISAPAKKDESTKAAKTSSKQQVGKAAKGKENKDKAPQQTKKPVENGSKCKQV